jgi:hypothetical protein
VLDNEVVPLANAPLDPWPSEFVVPVQLTDPTENAVWRVFVDLAFVREGSVLGASLDGGVSLVVFSIPQPDTTVGCPPRIGFMVGHGFSPTSSRTFDGWGGDLVTWLYYGGLSPGACPPYDAGDGSFPDGSGLLAPPPDAGDL